MKKGSTSRSKDLSLKLKNKRSLHGTLAPNTVRNNSILQDWNQHGRHSKPKQGMQSLVRCKNRGIRK